MALNDETRRVRWRTVAAMAGLCMLPLLGGGEADAQTSTTVLKFKATVETENSSRYFPKPDFFDFGKFSKNRPFVGTDDKLKKPNSLQQWKKRYMYEYRECPDGPCTIDKGGIAEAWKKLREKKKPLIDEANAAIAVSKIVKQCSERNLSELKNEICKCVRKQDDPLGCLENKLRFVYNLGRQ